MSKNGELAPDGTGSEPLKPVGISWPDATSLKAERPVAASRCGIKAPSISRSRERSLRDPDPAAMMALIKAEHATAAMQDLGSLLR